MEKQLLELIGRVRALSQCGLVYVKDEYDIERYQELVEISNQMTAFISSHSIEDISDCFPLENDYVTPKVDIRAVVFNADDEILLVQEKDGCWSLPGGWADVGYSPKEVAIKEVKEETGLDVAPVRLLAVMDKKHHNHPPALHYAYKIFILCELTGGEFRPAFDILSRGFFPQNSLPPLSLERVLKEQIDSMFDYKRNKQKEVIFD